MDLQVLVASMNQEDHSLLRKMNIRSNAIVANQCKKNKVEDFEYDGFKIKYLSFNERGVGLNRNNALMRADNDICLLADDDVVLQSNYIDIILKSFEEYPDADVIIFNLKEKEQKRFIIKKKMNIGYFNYMRFGAARIAFKRDRVTKMGITFNLHFGGGAEYCAGEDTLFLNSCLKKGLKIIALPDLIGELDNKRESTWFTGYNEEFFKDRGALFAALSDRWYWFLCLQFAIRRQNLFSKKIRWIDAYTLMLQGAKEFRKY